MGIADTDDAGVNEVVCMVGVLWIEDTGTKIVVTDVDCCAGATLGA